MMKDIQRITLQLDAHRVSLNVNRPDEPVYRQAAEMLNERFQHYRKRMPQASVEELWMYVALEVGVNLQTDARAKSIAPVMGKVNELNRLIADALSDGQETISEQETVTQ